MGTIMDTKDWIMVASVIAGPILAVQAQKRIELLRDKKQRKLRVFYTLMSTRATRLSSEHVGALNMIDIEFYGRKIFGHRWQSRDDKSVTNAWKTYNDHLNSKIPDDIKDKPEKVDSWNDLWNRKCFDLFAALLYAMSQALGYDFDEVQLKRDCYSPIAHGSLEKDQEVIRAGMVALMSGKPLPIAVAYLPPYHPIDPVQPKSKPA
jgi:hypothetical protein